MRAAAEVRRAERRDAHAIAEVLPGAFAAYASLYTGPAYRATTPTAGELLRRLSEGPAWVALRDGAIVGTVSAVPRHGGLYVRSMAVTPAARGRGVGELLLGEVERFAREHGFARLMLSTTPFLADAIRLYQRWGFRPSADGPDALFGTPLLSMAKTIPSSRVRHRDR